MNPLNPEPLLLENVWKDLVSDFLEMACFLTKDEQDLLILELARTVIEDDMIYVHPAFSIGGKLITVCERPEAREHWVYFPKTRRIQKKSGSFEAGRG